ncbi:unnamed protein product [Arctogadus glacialis]
MDDPEGPVTLAASANPPSWSISSSHKRPATGAGSKPREVQRLDKDGIAVNQVRCPRPVVPSPATLSLFIVKSPVERTDPWRGTVWEVQCHLVGSVAIKKD